MTCIHLNVWIMTAVLHYTPADILHEYTNCNVVNTLKTTRVCLPNVWGFCLCNVQRFKDGKSGGKTGNLPISEDNKKVEHSSCHEISILSPSRSFLHTTFFQLSSTFNAACQKLPIN